MTRQSVAAFTTFKTGSCLTLSRESKSWGRVRAEQVQRTGLKKEETSLTSRDHLVLLNLKGSSERGDYSLDGKPAGFARRRPGSILFVPAGCHWKGWEAGASSAAYLSITIDPAKVSELLGRDSVRRHPALSPDLGFEDPAVMHAVRGIGAEIHDQSALSMLLVESYVSAIFIQLFRRQTNCSVVNKAGGLAPKSFNRVMEKIEQDLAADLSLSQLADVAGVSIPHFCRAFKQMTGSPPYAFIIGRRIDRAKERLRSSDISITDIALDCGFSSSSHFANGFRRETGMSPAAYRRSFRQ